MDIWEYKIDIGGIASGKTSVDVTESLNKQGQEGWELVSVHTVTLGDQIEDWYIYKRLIKPRRVVG